MNRFFFKYAPTSIDKLIIYTSIIIKYLYIEVLKNMSWDMFCGKKHRPIIKTAKQ